MGKNKPQRTCTGCRTVRNKDELIRIVHTPEGSFAADRTGRMNGRGAYICPSAACLEKAKKSGGLERSFRMKVPEEIYALLLEHFAEEG